MPAMTKPQFTPLAPKHHTTGHYQSEHSLPQIYTFLQEAARHNITDIYVAKTHEIYATIGRHPIDPAPIIQRANIKRFPNAEEFYKLCKDSQEIRGDETDAWCHASTDHQDHTTVFRFRRTPTTRGHTMAIHVCAKQPNSLHELAFGPEITEHFKKPQPGLHVIAGDTGSGKTTTISTIIMQWAKEYALNIGTLEDPADSFIAALPNRWHKSFIMAQSIGVDFSTFETGVHEALHNNLDVLFISRIDNHTILKPLLDRAGAGRTILTTIHASKPDAVLTNLLNLTTGPQHKDLQNALSTTLQTILWQELDFADSGLTLRYQNVPVNDDLRKQLRNQE